MLNKGKPDGLSKRSSNHFPSRRLLVWIVPAALIACSGGAASGQLTAKSSVKTEVLLLGQSPTTSQQITIKRDGRVSELKIENGEIVSARHDGVEWPLDRVRMSDRSVELLGKDGAVAYEFELSELPAVPVAAIPSAPTVHEFRVEWGPAGSDGVGLVTTPPASPRTRAIPATPVVPPPPVMLGINMSEPGDALRAHLGLGDRPAILIESVIEGLPAAKVGLKKHDIIVSIAGSDGASDRMLGETLRNAKPGQTITLKVRRGGETIEVTPELEAYDAERLGSGTTAVILRSDNVFDPRRAERLEMDLENGITGWARRLAELAARGGQEAADEIQRLAEEIQAEGSRQVFELRDNRLFLRSREQLDARQEQFDALMQENRDMLQERVEEAQGQLQELRPRVQESMDDRLKQIESRMDSIEKSLDARLERLNAMLDRLADRLEKDNAE